jgi:hypothetical protein
MSTPEQQFTATDFEVANGRALVVVTYLPFPTPVVGYCRVTIYTATGPRHPVMADIKKSTMTGWESGGTMLVNDYPVGLVPSTFPQVTKFEFDCPAPEQFWEIHIQTAPYNPLPNYLDSMIGSCEARGFVIVYPGIISRLPVPKLINGTYKDFQVTEEQAKAIAEVKEQLEAGAAIFTPDITG